MEKKTQSLSQCNASDRSQLAMGERNKAGRRRRKKPKLKMQWNGCICLSAATSYMPEKSCHLCDFTWIRAPTLMAMLINSCGAIDRWWKEWQTVFLCMCVNSCIIGGIASSRLEIFPNCAPFLAGNGELFDLNSVRNGKMAKMAKANRVSVTACSDSYHITCKWWIATQNIAIIVIYLL